MGTLARDGTWHDWVVVATSVTTKKSCRPGEARKLRNLGINVFAILLAVFLIGSLGAAAAGTETQMRSTLAGSFSSLAQAVPPGGAAGDSPPDQPDLGLVARSAVLMEATTGQILYEKNSREAIGPASLVKIMTMFLAFDALKQGQVSPDTTFMVSEKAWSKNVVGSKMFIEVGKEVSVRDLLMGIAVSSGNDASIAMAEGLSGSEEAFVRQMNEKARQLGLEETTFANSHGLPAEGQTTTARDMALLARSFLREHPDLRDFTSARSFTFNGITQPNRNGLLAEDSRVFGIKTGHTEESGFHLLSAAEGGGMTLISVVMGIDAPSLAVGFSRREADTRKLLDYGFLNFSLYRAPWKEAAGESLRVWKGSANRVRFQPAEEPVTVIPRGGEEDVVVTAELDKDLSAPISRGQRVGTLNIKAPPDRERRIDLVAAEEVPRGGLIKVVLDSIRLFFARVFRRV